MQRFINKINTFFAKHCLSLIKKGEERVIPNVEITIEHFDVDKKNEPQAIQNNEIDNLFDKQFIRKKKSNSFRTDFIHRTGN